MLPYRLAKDLSIQLNTEADPQFKEFNVSTAMKNVIISQVLLNINLAILGELKTFSSEIQVKIDETTVFQSNHFTDESLNEFFQYCLEEIRVILADYIKNAGYSVRLSHIDKSVLCIDLL